METKTDYSTTKATIISTPLPQQTRTYKPIGNQQLIDLTLNGITNAGFTLDKEIYNSAKEGMVSNGRYTIKNVADSEMQLQITWRNSYNKSLPLSFSIGALILVCSNGLQKSQGMGSFKKKHQGQIQEFTPHAISEYIKGAEETFKQIQKERDIMKQITLTRSEQARIIGEMFIEEEFVKSTQLNIIKRELDCPTYNYGNEDSLWSLYQYTTFAMREIHPSLYLQDHLNAHNFYVNQAGILIEKPAQIIINTENFVAPNQLDLFENIEELIADSSNVVEDVVPVDVIEELPAESSLSKYFVIVMSDDPELEDTDDPHRKYRMEVEANSPQEADLLGVDKFEEEYPGQMIYWSKVYKG